jgi:alpha-mannosidase
MKLQELVILLSCHGMEDFPLYHTGDEAESLLSAWTGLWHPALLASAEGLPVLHRTDDPPEDLAGRVLVIPKISEPDVAVGFTERAVGDGACVIRDKLTRQEVVTAALAVLDVELGGGDACVAPAELIADFLALGYAYLQVNVLTRQMRYTDNLDDIHFSNEVVAGAKAAVAGDEATAREHLQRCYDVLAESKDQCYPVDSYILDLTLVAASTLGEPLRKQLASKLPVNFLLTGELVEQMAEQEPASIEALRTALSEERVGLVGGAQSEGPLPLEPIEAVLADLQRGIATFEKHLGQRPTVFARRRAGLSPILPQILKQTGFIGALHSSFDGSRVPQSSQCKTLWTGCDETAIDALVRNPQDAASADSFLTLAEKLSEAMDHDQVATVCFAHWPGQTSVWYDDLRRIASFGPSLGRFVSLTEYFGETVEPYERSDFLADEYRLPYLKDAVAAELSDPISSHVERHRKQAETDAVAALDCLSAVLESRSGVSPLSGDLATQDHQQTRQDAASTLTATERFAVALPREKGSNQKGCLIANPCSFARRVGVDVSSLPGLPAIEKPVHAAQESNGKKRIVVDVPPMGFAWVGASDQPSPPTKGKKDIPLAEENTLRNEFMEVRIDPTTGSIRAIGDYVQRSGRVSQQLAFRKPGPKAKAGDVWRDPDEQAEYSVMAADSIEVTSSGPALGEIVAKGRLLDKSGKRLAGFTQTMRLWRGSRVLLLDIQLDPNELPGSDPWQSYYASRFAWNDATSDVWRGISSGRHPTAARRLEAPHYVELQAGPSRTTLLTGGLPYHRRSGMRMLDSLLVVRGETARRFQMGIGLDLTYPMAAATDLLAPETCARNIAGPPTAGTTSWLFHLSAKNALATHWRPLVEDGHVVGAIARILETEGRSSTCKLSAFRPIASARRLDLLGNPLNDLKVEDGVIVIEMTGHGWVEVEARWPS